MINRGVDSMINNMNIIPKISNKSDLMYVLRDFESNLRAVKNAVQDEVSGQYKLPESLIADMNDFEPRCLTAFMQRNGINKYDDVYEEDKIWLRLQRVASLPAEAYFLTVSERGINISAATEQGVIWALVTVTELMDDNRFIPFMELPDAPRYNYRGVMLDCVRHFFPVDEVKRIIEQISLVKMNVLHWHLTDDQGWRIESLKFPNLHSLGGEYFSQNEIRDIVEFARIRGVEIIPEINIPGHTTGLLAAYPEFSCSGKKVEYATCGGIYNIILCPGKERTYGFLEALLDEVCKLFPSQYVHIGGDEAPKTEWKKCPDCIRTKDELGLNDWEALQGHFTSRVVQILHKSNKKAVLWNDALKAGNISAEVVTQFWTQQYSKELHQHSKSGGSFIFSDMFRFYFDYPHVITPLKKVYRTRPKVGRHDSTYVPGLLGIEACLWTEHVYDCKRLEQLLFPRVFAIAELAWSREFDYNDFLNRLQVKFKKLSEAGIEYTPLADCNLKGKIRRKEAIEFFSAITMTVPPEVRKNTIEAANASVKFMFLTIWNFFKFSDLPALIKSIRKTLQ